MFRKEDDICICTEYTDWTTFPAGPVSLRRAAIRGTLLSCCSLIDKALSSDMPNGHWFEADWLHCKT